MPSLSNRKIRRLLTSEDFGIGVETVPFTFTYPEAEPAQLLNMWWIYTADALVLPRVPFCDINDTSLGNRYVQISGRNVLGALTTENAWSAQGSEQIPFFAVRIMGAIPPDFWLKQNMTMRFFSFFGNGAGDFQAIQFQLAQYN